MRVSSAVTTSRRARCRSSGASSVDAFFLLKKAVGENLALACDCPVVTTTTTTTLPQSVG